MTLIRDEIVVQVNDKRISIVHDTPACVGNIKIGSFEETFDMYLGIWKIPDYEKQWQEGLQRIKTHSQSCLVTQVYDLKKFPFVNTWPLYREGNKIIVQNRILVGKDFKKIISKKPFTLENCYEFVEPHKTLSDDGSPISEWEVNLKDC